MTLLLKFALLLACNNNNFDKPGSMISHQTCHQTTRVILQPLERSLLNLPIEIKKMQVTAFSAFELELFERQLASFELHLLVNQHFLLFLSCFRKPFTSRFVKFRNVTKGFK